ncbi:MAG TPA: hypothetical protein VL418_12365 [Devosiaceae bacterium]|nr:hypothetical protein [Devosiaceae bacterium]
MTPTNHYDDIIPQDTGSDEASMETSVGQPLSEAEIEDLLYGDGRSTEERLRLLRALRRDLADREAGDLGDDDPGTVINEIDSRIAELENDEVTGEEPGAYDNDPLAHRETLSPDSDELDELEQEDEASLDEEDDWLDAEENEKEETEDLDDEEDEGDIVDNDDDVPR